jgi:hypothetical protein
MNGTITFESWSEVAEFLKEFTGSTATFNIHREGSRFILKFLGGY